MSDQLQIFEEQNSHESTSSLSEVLARILALPESARECLENEAPLSRKQLGSLMNADQEYLCGKMLRELSPQTMAKILRPSSKRLPTLGVIHWNGSCLIQRGFSPKIVRESTLSDILEDPATIPDQYFLSTKQVEKISLWKAQEQPLAKLLRQEAKQTYTPDSNS